ncbi:MAG: SCP2 sterol-binding domain-containing protein [Nitrosomonadales bacterium]|nr:SCP2 sterol-binding domain-containing protein [Nitrosomonadales bacterium]
MNNQPFILPKPVSGILAILPGYPKTLLFVQAVNLALGDTLRSDVMQPLQNKLISIRVTDAGMAFYFFLGTKGLVACRRNREPELTISASAHDFLMLALRKEDPDTLFFSRRLCMEGDTELGLLLKNTLDAMELPPFNLRSLSPPRILAEIRTRLLN